MKHKESLNLKTRDGTHLIRVAKRKKNLKIEASLENIWDNIK